MTNVAVSEPAVEAPPKLSFAQTIRSLPRSFWMGCTMEMWERLAYYGVRVVMPIYIAQADEPGGLHFSQQDKGTIYMVWALIQSLLPMITGGYADRYGYKRTIFITVWLKIIGYLLMATQRSFTGFLLGVVILATGTALFKPGIQGTLAQSMDKSNSSVGWGLFYWLVNIGAAIGPPLAGYLHGKGWSWVFYGCAAIISLNFLMLLTYKEVDSGADKTSDAWKVFKDTIKNIWDARLITVILLLSGFWLMMYQLWDLMPNFYTDWISSTSFVQNNPWIPTSWLDMKDPRGVQLKQENVLNVNSVSIVLLLVPFSYLVARMKVLSAMTLGILVAIFGILVSGTTSSLYVLFLGILLFSIGEMLTGPKKSEYFALIAPQGKKALYLGYVNIPAAIGPAIGALMAGILYGTRGEKATLALRYLAEKTDLAKGKAWNGDVASLSDLLGVSRQDAFKTLQATLHIDATEATRLLWDTYQPYEIWYSFAVIGVVSLVGMLLFSRRSRRWKDLDV
ncbi:MFS transporter [Sorangium sp. So ce375]|uniref:MFS transporter n=1 Tax=Sorangium sp. So ce375 TaxID=3133306 RepID=UPI003F5B8C45